MDPRVLAIPIGFILLAGLLCWQIIFARGKWSAKLLFIVLVPSFGLVVWASLSTYLGWPAAENPQGKSVLLWAEIREPYPPRNDPGSILVWVIPFEEGEEDMRLVFEYASMQGEPRAHRLRYTREGHEQMFQALEMIKRGRPVVLEWTEKKQDDKAPPQRGQDGMNRYPESEEEEFKVYELPPPVMPQKDDP